MSDFKGVQVFIVEDESLITMLLEDILDDLGCGLAASAGSLRDALDKAATVTANIAILDINLAGDPIFPVAERLVARGIPIVFASGYGASTLPEEWRNRPTLPKPFTSRQVEEAIAAALQSKAA
jgi:two-component SAPR family response regulator